MELRTGSATIRFVRFVTKRILTRGRDISLFVLCQQNENRIIPKCTDLPVRIYLSTHSVTEKVIEMEIGIYITVTIIYLGRELCLGVCGGCCPLLAK